MVKMRQQTARENIHRQRRCFQHHAFVRVIGKIMRCRRQPPGQPPHPQRQGQQEYTDEPKIRAGQGTGKEFPHSRYCTRKDAGPGPELAGSLCSRPGLVQMFSNSRRCLQFPTPLRQVRRVLPRLFHRLRRGFLHKAGVIQPSLHCRQFFIQLGNLRRLAAPLP